MPTKNEPQAVTYTTAPVDYDWFGTKTVDAFAGKDARGRIIRKVSGPKSRVEAQRCRYGSGLHLAADEVEWSKLVEYKFVEPVPATAWARVDAGVLEG